MDRVEEPSASSPSGEAKARTPAYASFESSTDRLFHLLQFILRGLQDFSDELKTEIAQLGRPQGKEASDQEARNSAEMMDDRAQRISDTLLKPIKQFTDGFLTVREWIPALLVTTVEAYLEDVLIYAAKVDPAIMESSRPTVQYAEVVRARSLEELKEELRDKLPPRWAKKFLDDHDRGPDSWMKEASKNGRTWVSSRNR